ncbi:hypothetical protein Cob_v011058 [Colletotrichum orbiculare MAFF 240422]|uniref:Rhodopsin domain-containing protein n=1 Tax=Colletotrichum orbiculare (strain 104-T / ATCC 96160 / CBS 514.97 / LARS 414 / MAFF 240422) TaxID=1213857 RepID=N4VT51_COLOR|nr:hypothetical protein Cob_v011058 [Colletotrichum orbiculare MAFF 240422]
MFSPTSNRPPETVSDAPPDQNIGPIWLAVSTTLLIPLILTTLLRLWVRIACRKVGWDDVTIILSLLMTVVRYSFGVMQLSHGNGRHRRYLTDYDYMMINKWGWYGQVFHFLAMTLLKVSVSCLVLRMKDSRSLRTWVYALIVPVVFFNMGAVVILLAECKPTGFWRGASAQCWDNRVRIYWNYAAMAYSILTDFVLSLIPLAVVWKIKIPFQKKLMVVALMSLGLIASTFGIVRAASLGVCQEDLSWSFCIVAIWSNIELFLGIIAANLALSRAIYLYFREGSGSKSRGRANTSGFGYADSGYRGDGFKVSSTFISSKLRRATSKAPSSNSDIPLEPGIQKKTEFWWREDEGSGRAASQQSDVDIQPAP